MLFLIFCVGCKLLFILANGREYCISILKTFNAIYLIIYTCNTGHKPSITEHQQFTDDIHTRDETINCNLLHYLITTAMYRQTLKLVLFVKNIIISASVDFQFAIEK